ncbi:MAG TPA: TldD/PmbA family protein [Gemmatimonadales bacterium]|nr:TldD/PmbA family protein [Gemmatimonadales bacterium]
MKRRHFLEAAGLGAGALILPPGTRFWNGALTAIPSADKKALADAGLEAARKAGASYADLRIGRYLNQSVSTRERRVQGIGNSESFGVGVRVIVDGTWGFAATPDVTPESVARTATRAVAIAKANARLQTEPVRLAPVPGYGEVSWKSPIQKNAMEIPVQEKVDLLLAVNAAALGAGARFVNSAISVVNEQKYFASTDGTYADQDLHRIWPTFTVTATDPATGRFQTRDALSAPIGLGWEYLQAGSGRPGPTAMYGLRYDMVEDATLAAAQAREKLTARSVEAGRWDLVIDPTQLFLTIHESVGHSTELDRVLGYEANNAGTSFATLDKWKTRSFPFGNKLVNFVADRTQPGSLGEVGWDDEGVKARQWDLVREGILVGYQATRDQVHILGEKEGHGCSYADSWESVQFQRMPNVSLSPGRAPLTQAELIAGVDRGILFYGRSTYSIDQQRYNFQFGGQLCFEIRSGKITGLLNDVAYQANTREFWNSVSAICDQRDYRLNGTFRDGKGQPGQISAVSHGCATTRFSNVNVINTGRSLG